MGANHPYPNAPKEAGEELAKELGFEVLPAVQFALTPGDYTAQCLTLKDSGANYAYLGNTAGSNISVLRACDTVGVKVQFMGNVWGMDENAMKAAGKAADGVVFPVRTGAVWGGEAPGMQTVKEVSKISDASGNAYRPVHYISGICSAYLMKEAMEWAAKNGGIYRRQASSRACTRRRTGCRPAWKASAFPRPGPPEDHRGTTTVAIYRAKVSGATEASVDELVKAGTIKLEKVTSIDLPRKKEWLGW